MKLIGSSSSPYVRKVRMVMAEKKLDYNYVTDNVWAPDTTISESNPADVMKATAISICVQLEPALRRNATSVFGPEFSIVPIRLIYDPNPRTTVFIGRAPAIDRPTKPRVFC